MYYCSFTVAISVVQVYMSQWSNYMSRQLVLFVAKNLHLHTYLHDEKKMLSLDYLSVILTLSISEGKYATLQHLYLYL